MNYEDDLKSIAVNLGRIAGYLQEGLTITPAEAGEVQVAAEALKTSADWMADG